MAQWTIDADIARDARVLLPYVLFALRSYNDLSGAKTFAWSDVPAAMPDQFIEPAIASWGRIVRALSEDDGAFEVQAFEFSVADVARDLLALGDDPDWRYWTNRVASLYLIEQAAKDAGDTPMLVTRGLVRTAEPESRRIVAFTAEDYLTTEFSAADLDELLPRRRIEKARFAPTPAEEPGWTDAVAGLPEPIVYGSVTVPCYPAGATLIAGNPNWVRLLVAGHACKGVTEVYVDGVAATGRYGVDVLCPGKAGWPHGTPYVDLGGRRYTVLYLIGPDATAAVAGSRVVSAAVEGVESGADSFGTLLTDIYDQFLHWYVNFAIGDYQTGVWLTAPTYPDGTSYVDGASFVAAKASIAYRNGGAGYPGSGVVGNNGDRRTKREWIAAWCASADGRAGFNRRGQFMVASGQKQAAILALTDRDDIVLDGFVTDNRQDDLRNVVPYAFDRDWVAGVWGVDGKRVVSTRSQTGYRQRQEAPTRALWFVRGAAQADDVGLHVLHRFMHPPRRASVTSGLHLLLADLGDTITVTHPDGPGIRASYTDPMPAGPGWVDRPLLVERIAIDPAEGLVTVTGWDYDMLDGWDDFLTAVTYEPGLTPSGTFSFGGGGAGGGSGTVAVAIGLPIDLGGSRSLGVRSATWRPVAEWKHAVVPAGFATAQVRVEVRTRDAGTSVTARLVDVDTAAVLWASTPSTSTSWQELEPETVSLPTGWHRYRLDVIGGNADAEIFAVGVLVPQ